MQPGRKILNLRRDRRISQQDLARACDITPSALSKIEAGINSPRALVIWRLAAKLGVTVEYLLDESIPYPFPPYSYRQELFDSDVDPDSTVRMEVTREERAFLRALRESNVVAREVALSVPELSVEVLRMVHFLVNHARIVNPSLSFVDTFQKLVTTGEVPGEAGGRGQKKGSKAPASRSATSRSKRSGSKTSRSKTTRRGTKRKPAKSRTAGRRPARSKSGTGSSRRRR